MFLKIEQVENLIITTMSLIYRNVLNGKHPYSQCIQMHNRLIVLYIENIMIENTNKVEMNNNNNKNYYYYYYQHHL